VEASPAPPDWPAIASRVLPADACLAIHALPRQRQESAFLQAWCHLEAHLKLVGTGFRSPAVAHADSTPCRRWTLSLPRAYFGSVAMALS
jgi:4'-phosphopantetheinyl transferase